MPIGRFSSASRLSVKSLRNYDQSGLLSAAHVDLQSGYRYYRLEQLARAEIIRSLRLLDMPLAEIAEILDGEDPEGTLTSHLAELARKRDDYERKVQRLQRLISRKEITMSDDVVVKSIESQTVAAYRTATTHTAIFEDIPAGFDRVIGFIGSASVEPFGAPFTMYHTAPEGDAPGDISMCVPIAKPIQPGDGIDIVDVPAGTVASVIHRGPYDEMGKAYASVAAWIHERGHRSTGPSREIYLNNPGDVADTDLLTEIQWPIDSDTGGRA